MGVSSKSLDEVAIKFIFGVFKIFKCEEFEAVPVIGSFLNFLFWWLASLELLPIMRSDVLDSQKMKKRGRGTKTL